ncbi:MAG: uroporphyrinogen-III C-methyltransferase [candidate division NC10 bacterium]|nr:uroporphyrinogen-III C-methyltransferase [Candidatus Rokubacteria bacterium]MBI2563059.1 uroporphyrinogen-III C-methyltransferase [candidate division NC10 bacterium]
MTGTVYLVGAGPGDPGLLTLKAARILESADVVVYDYLVGDAILDRIPASAERVYAGKETGSHAMNQVAINELLEERARRGQTVVRLKGGDPFVFGRGGEEAEYLTERGIPFEVVPGVTSAVGVPAYAGIPVTHRGVAASLAVVTGRAGPVGEAPDIDWERISGADTIVALMGVANQEPLVRALVDGGRSPETPVAAIRWGTTAQQRVVVGTLATIGDRMREVNLRPPAILVVGDVVSLLPRVRWAERRPLFGRRVLIPSSYPSAFTAPLERLGAEVLHVAPVELTPPPSWELLDRTLRNVRSFAGVVFADDAGVAAVIERLTVHGQDARTLAGCLLVAGSREAACALRRFALRADAVVEDDSSDLPGGGSEAYWLVVGSPDVQQLITSTLAHHGSRAVTPPICTMTTTKWRADRLREVLTSRPVHAIVFVGPAEVRRLVGALDVDERPLLRSMVLAAVGEATRVTLSQCGFEPAITTIDPSPPALAATLAAALGRSSDDERG